MINGLNKALEMLLENFDFDAGTKHVFGWCVAQIQKRCPNDF